MVKFAHYEDKDRVIYSRIPCENSINTENNFSSMASKEIQMIQDNTLNLAFLHRGAPPPLSSLPPQRLLPPLKFGPKTIEN